MKNLFILLILCCGLFRVNAQSDSVAIYVDSCQCGTKNYVLDFVEEMPEPEVGWTAWPGYIASQIQLADSTLKKGPGTVYIGFVVDVNGEICSSLIRKGCPDAPEFDAEALRIVRESGKWTPGKMNGKSVCVRMTIPIKICVQ